jgi:hypothetical protein
MVQLRIQEDRLGVRCEILAVSQVTLTQRLVGSRLLVIRKRRLRDYDSPLHCFQTLASCACIVPDSRKVLSVYLRQMAHQLIAKSMKDKFL